MDIERIKNELKNHVADSVRDEAKDATIGWLKEKVLPAAKEVADTYTAALHESAANETGWNKFRDTFFLPTLLDASFWLLDKALTKMVNVPMVTDHA